ncbi:MAG: winged helix-turn-helix domain-containing protein, partial [Pyrinomonadaceae bacterium]
MEPLKAKHFRFAGYEVDGAKRLLSKEGEPLPLNSKSFDLLMALIERNGEVLSKNELLEAVWPGQFVEEGNLTVHVSALRKILGERKDEHRFIVTVPGRGYSFVADLEKADEGEIVVESHRESRIIVTEQSVINDSGDPDVTGTHLQLKSRAGLWRALVLGFAAAILAIAGFGFWFFSSSRYVISPQIESIAVMPFINESANADIEYLSDGMTEILINNLSQLPRLSVKARSSVF